MSNTDKVNAGPGYRLLAKGEKIQIGDEWLWHFTGWTTTCHPGDEVCYATYRRKIETGASVPAFGGKNTELWRMLEVGERIEAGDEFYESEDGGWGATFRSGDMVTPGDANQYRRRIYRPTPADAQKYADDNAREELETLRKRVADQAETIGQLQAADMKQRAELRTQRERIDRLERCVDLCRRQAAAMIDTCQDSTEI